jgi:hypothetical protein
LSGAGAVHHINRDISRRSKNDGYSITSSARASGVGGISRDRASSRRFDPYFFARSIT